MFRKFWNWLFGDKEDYNLYKPKEDYNLYKPKERTIFSYYDGTKMVRADPMVLYRKMMEKGPELNIDMKVATSQSKDASAAEQAVINKICDIFSIKRLDQESGLGETEIIDLFDAFLIYTEVIKKKSKSLVILPKTTSQNTLPPIAGGVSVCSNSDPLIPKYSDSGSIENVPNIEKPNQSSLE